MTNGNGLSMRWLQWLIPTGLVGAMSVAFSVGLWVGRSEVRTEIAELRQSMAAHIAIPQHSGAPSRDVLEVRIQEMIRRLERIEMSVNRITNNDVNR